MEGRAVKRLNGVPGLERSLQRVGIDGSRGLFSLFKIEALSSMIRSYMISYKSR